VGQPIISVIVPHLNQQGSLEACLGSIDAQTLDRGLFEVVVVDNGSKQLPETVIRRHAGTRLFQELEPGPGLARNRGVKEARGAVLAFIDADCRAHPDWLRVAMNVMSATDENTILGGDVQIWRDKGKIVSAIEAYECVFAYRFKLYIERHNFSGTGNLVVRRSDFEKVGPFAGISIAEDIDWGKRAHAAGCIFRYVPEMIVYHPARQSVRELFVKWDRHLQHAVNLSDGTMAWRMRWVARAIAVFASPVVDWPKVISSDRIQGFSARSKALATLIVIRAYRGWRMIALLGQKSGVVWNRDGAVEESKSGKNHRGNVVSPNN
jgi:glycosyltransferase involved in cell wall biosynthesis